MKIIGYFHVCQSSPWWTDSFDNIWGEIVRSGLYEASEEIRVCVVNAELVSDERFNDPKIRVHFMGEESQYERPTILHMRARSELEEAAYFYVHTKGLRHYGQETYKNVQAWIRVLLHANVTRWVDAFDIISKDEADTYGCLFNKLHYVGNFWWSSSKHVRTLPTTMSEDYSAAEWWVTNTQFIRVANEFKYYGDPYKYLPPKQDYQITVERKFYLRSALLAIGLSICLICRMPKASAVLAVCLAISILWRSGP